MAEHNDAICPLRSIWTLNSITFLCTASRPLSSQITWWLSHAWCDVSQRVSMSPSPVFTLHTAWSQASLCCCPAWCHSGTDSDPTYAMAQVTGKVDTTIKIVWTQQNLNSYCIVNSSANTFIAGKECDVPCDVLVSWCPASTPGVARSVCPVRRRSAIVGSSHAQGERWPRAETIYNVK